MTQDHLNFFMLITATSEFATKTEEAIFWAFWITVSLRKNLVLPLSPDLDKGGYFRDENGKLLFRFFDKKLTVYFGAGANEGE